METKEEKFKRLAEARMNKALEQFKLIENLASSNYSFTPEQVQKIVVSLQMGVASLERTFQKALDKRNNKFEF